MGRLYEYIQTFEEPTLIVFMGDHLPYLYSSDYTNVIDRLDFFNTDNEKTNLFRRYNTQCLILSNYDMGEFNIPKYLGVDQVLTYIVNRMDIENNDYYKWLENKSKIVAGFNEFVTMDYKGELYLTRELRKNMQEAYSNREMMQYMLFIK